MLRKVLLTSVAFSFLGSCVFSFIAAAESVPKATNKAASKNNNKTESDVSPSSGRDGVRLGQRLSDALNGSFGCDTGLTFDGKGIFLNTAVKQDDNSGKDDVTFVYDGEFNIHFLKRVNGLGFGIESCLKTRSAVIKGDRAIVDALYAYIESDMLGRLILGWAGTAADSFTIGGNSICTAYGGPDSGNLGNFYNQAAGTIVGTGCSVDDGKALKVGWYSPVYRGFSLGMTYTFNSRHAAPFKQKMCSENCNPAAGGEHVCWDYAHSSGYSKKIFTIAGQYEYGSEEGFNAKLAAGGWFGKAEPGVSEVKGGVHNVRAWFIGTILGYKDFKAAFGYIDNGRSIVDKYETDSDENLKFENLESDKFTIGTPGVGLKKGADAGKIYTCGVSYKIDRLTTYAGYFHSVVKYSNNSSEKAKADIVTLGLEYKVNNIWSVFAEYDHMNTKTCDRARIYAKLCEQGDGGDNKANLYMVGVKVFF